MQVEKATIESNTASGRWARSRGESRTALTGTEFERFERAVTQRGQAQLLEGCA